MFKVFEVRVLKVPRVEKKLVVVALVPVALVKVKFWRVEEAVAKMLVKVPKFTEALVEKRLVIVPVSAESLDMYEFVVVALVVEALVVTSFVVVELVAVNPPTVISFAIKEVMLETAALKLLTNKFVVVADSIVPLFALNVFIFVSPDTLKSPLTPADPKEAFLAMIA